jgi:hypothetical protein
VEELRKEENSYYSRKGEIFISTLWLQGKQKLKEHKFYNINNR